MAHWGNSVRRLQITTRQISVRILLVFVWPISISSFQQLLCAKHSFDATHAEVYELLTKYIPNHLHDKTDTLFYKFNRRKWAVNWLQHKRTCYVGTTTDNGFDWWCLSHRCVCVFCVEYNTIMQLIMYACWVSFPGVEPFTLAYVTAYSDRGRSILHCHLFCDMRVWSNYTLVLSPPPLDLCTLCCYTWGNSVESLQTPCTL